MTVTRPRNARRCAVAFLAAAALLVTACGQKAGVHTLAARSGLDGGGPGGDAGLGATADAQSGTGAGGQGAAGAAAGRSGSDAGGPTAGNQRAAGGGASAAGAGAQGAGDTTGITGDTITVGVHGPVTG